MLAHHVHMNDRGNNATEGYPMITASTRIIPVSDKNRVKNITRLDDGGMRVEFRSGEVVTLGKGDARIQEFIVYSVLFDL